MKKEYQKACITIHRIKPTHIIATSNVGGPDAEGIYSKERYDIDTDVVEW